MDMVIVHYNKFIYGTDTSDVSQMSLRLFGICIALPIIPLCNFRLGASQTQRRKSKEDQSSAITPEILRK